MTQLHVQYFEMWDDDHCTFDVLGVVTDKSHRWELETCWVKEAKPGDEVWVLWIEYRSGDSLTTTTGEGEIIATFTSAERALAARDAWDASRRSDVVCFVDDGGEATCLQNPAADYFSAITTIHIDKFTVDDCPPSRYE